MLYYLQQPSSQQHPPPPQHEPQSGQHTHGQPESFCGVDEAAPRPAKDAVTRETTPRKRVIVDSIVI